MIHLYNLFLFPKPDLQNDIDVFNYTESCDGSFIIFTNKPPQTVFNDPEQTVCDDRFGTSGWKERCNHSFDINLINNSSFICRIKTS